MWWLSQAELKDVLNRWICSSFQPMSAQNIPHLDPRGSWIFVVPQESLIVCCWCTEWDVKGIEPKFTRWEKHHDSGSNTRRAPLNHWRYQFPGVSGFVCSGGRRVGPAAKTQLISSLLLSNIWQEKWFIPNCSRDSTKNFKLKGKGKEGEWHRDVVLASSAKKKGKRPSQWMHMGAYALV